MQKIISLFQRNYETDRLVRDEVVPGAEWVLAGEGVATRKYDGVCTMIRNGELYKRFEVHAKHREQGKIPFGWEPADEMDPVTMKQQGWILVDPADPANKYMLEAFQNTFHGNGSPVTDGTYEFLGPKSQGNVEEYGTHFLMPHGAIKFHDSEVPRTFDGLKAYFEVQYAREKYIEGIVWHHPDGRMVKIKAKDFGIKRPAKKSVPA